MVLPTCLMCTCKSALFIYVVSMMSPPRPLQFCPDTVQGGCIWQFFWYSHTYLGLGFLNVLSPSIHIHRQYINFHRGILCLVLVLCTCQPRHCLFGLDLREVTKHWGRRPSPLPPWFLSSSGLSILGFLFFRHFVLACRLIHESSFCGTCNSCSLGGRPLLYRFLLTIPPPAWLSPTGTWHFEILPPFHPPRALLLHVPSRSSCQQILGDCW